VPEAYLLSSVRTNEWKQLSRTLQAKRRSNTLLRSSEDTGNGKKLLKYFLGKIETERRSKFENL
jgi:hypothetical protein